MTALDLWAIAVVWIAVGQAYGFSAGLGAAAACYLLMPLRIAVGSSEFFDELRRIRKAIESLKEPKP